MLRPAPADFARFPPNFGRKFIVCVDTEEEFDWSKPKRRDANSVEAIRALPVAQARMRAAGVRPAYLMDYPVAASPEAVGIIGRFFADGECTIGAQLHPWVNPPFIEPMAVRNSFPGNLPREVERAKLKNLTEVLAQGFHHRPTVYRAGRYGVGPNTPALLDELGYRIDCSVRPLFSYRKEDGPSFWEAPTHPYWTGPEHRILELPLTSIFVGGLSMIGTPLFKAGEAFPHLRAALSRTGLLNRVALTPEGMPLSETLEGMRKLVDTGAELFSIAFHSPSVEPGHTPFVRDEKDLATLYGWLDGVFDFCARHGIAASTPEEVHAEALRAESLAGMAAPALTAQAAE